MSETRIEEELEVIGTTINEYLKLYKLPFTAIAWCVSIILIPLSALGYTPISSLLALATYMVSMAQPRRESMTGTRIVIIQSLLLGYLVYAILVASRSIAVPSIYIAILISVLMPFIIYNEFVEKPVASYYVLVSRVYEEATAKPIAFLILIISGIFLPFAPSIGIILIVLAAALALIRILVITRMRYIA